MLRAFRKASFMVVQEASPHCSMEASSLALSEGVDPRLMLARSPATETV